MFLTTEVGFSELTSLKEICPKSLSILGTRLLHISVLHKPEGRKKGDQKWGIRWGILTGEIGSRGGACVQGWGIHDLLLGKGAIQRDFRGEGGNQSGRFTYKILGGLPFSRWGEGRKLKKWVF